MNYAALMCVTYNRLELTKQTFSNLIKTTDYPFYLIIVDNGSQDGTVQYLKELKANEEEYKKYNSYFQGFIIKLNKKNMGIAVGRNQGLLLANKLQVEWLSTIDNDIELPNGWLSECIDIIKANPKFVIGVNMENTNYPLTSKNNKTFQLKPKGNLGSACMVFHADLHNLVGFFCTEYGQYGEEDSDIGFRFRVAGYSLGYLEKIGIHLGENEVGPYREFKTICHANNLAKFQQNCHLYANKKKPYYILFEDNTINENIL